jgi:hypothetical protein
MLPAVVFTAITALSSQTLSVGQDAYAPCPAIRLGSLTTSEVFSRDGAYVAFVDERAETSYSAARDRIAIQGESPGRSLVRVDLLKGTRQILYTPGPNETLIGIETVGRSGDLLCSIAKENLPKSQISWKAIYCPVNGGVQVVADQVAARSFQFAGSSTARKAFILICNEDDKTRYLYLSEDTAEERSLNIVSYQGGFYFRSPKGNPIVGLQGSPPNYSPLGFYELSFVDGSAERLPSLPSAEELLEKTPLIRFSVDPRSPSDTAKRRLPLGDLVAVAGRQEQQKEVVVVEQGIIGITLEGPDGLGVVYRRDDGVYVRSMVKLRIKGSKAGQSSRAKDN